MITRRHFLRSSSLLALAPTIPLFIARSTKATNSEKDSRVLVVIQLDGGNDALNTIVPFTDPNYEKLRPKLKLNPKNLVKLNDSLGLHPSMKPLDRLLQAGQLTVIPGVGYPNPNRSHFESMAVWHTARMDEEDFGGYGWLGRALDPSLGASYMIGGAIPTALRGSRSPAMGLSRIEEVLLSNPNTAKKSLGEETSEDLLSFVRRQAVDAQFAADKLAQLTQDRDNAKYPSSALAERLKLVARLMKANLGARVFYTQQTGYDTHSTQGFTHSNLLSNLSGAIAAFFEDLTSAKIADRVILVAFSEFGRTIKENGSAGTDHGTAGAVFLAGPGVKGGVHGTMPNLTDLDKGEPKMTTDFRNIYSTLLDGWMGLASKASLGGEFKPLEILKG